MDRNEVKHIFGKNFIGLEDQKMYLLKLGFEVDGIVETDIVFSDSLLKKAASDGYLLIYGLEQVGDTRITLRYLREVFGIDPILSEPCFYNQDWYLGETFMDLSLNSQWYLLRMNVYEDSRAVEPRDLMSHGIHFPPAILCAYAFFAYYYRNGEYLWWHDFVWCNDLDHNGDRIYVGKYHDIDGVNKNGFSIHRHLALRPCYAALDCL